MTGPAPCRSPRRSEGRSVLSLRRTRALLRGSNARLVAIVIGGTYAILALFAGSMLQVGPTRASGMTVQLLENPVSHQWWNYPAVFVVAPGGVLVLPWFATVTMVLVSVGVGCGMAAGLSTALRLLRGARRERPSGGVASVLAGISPALVALLALGACCSTTAVAAGDLGALTAVTGIRVAGLTLNPWCLDLIEVAVLGCALLGQEALLVVYARLGLAPVAIGPVAGARAGLPSPKRPGPAGEEAA